MSLPASEERLDMLSLLDLCRAGESVSAGSDDRGRSVAEGRSCFPVDCAWFEGSVLVSTAGVGQLALV